MTILLETIELTKHYGGLKATNEVNLHINTGEIVSLIGPNGAGKTTLFNLLSGFTKVTNGQIIFDGKNITDLQPHQIAEMGLIRTFQATKTFKGVTVLDGVIMGSHRLNKPNIFGILTNSSQSKQQEKKCKGNALEIIKYFNLEKYKNVVAKSLPYGEQKILEIAVALSAEPILLLLDEPVVGLNPNETKKIVNLIREINQQRNMTVLIVEHDMSMVMNISDRIIVLNAGKIIAEGTPDEIKNNKEVIKAYLGGLQEYVV